MELIIIIFIIINNNMELKLTILHSSDLVAEQTNALSL